MNISDFMKDSKFCQILDSIDTELVRATQGRHCPRPLCGQSLDRADYVRKVDPLTVGCSASFAKVYALCCRKCRRRVRVPSVRFAGRMRTILPLFLLASLFIRTLTTRRIHLLKARLAVTESTLRRWRSWFAKIFPRTKTIRRLQGVAPALFHESGIRRFVVMPLVHRELPHIAALLKWFSPLNFEMFTLHDGLSPPAENG